MKNKIFLLLLFLFCLGVNFPPLYAMPPKIDKKKIENKESIKSAEEHERSMTDDDVENDSSTVEREKSFAIGEQEESDAETPQTTVRCWEHDDSINIGLNNRGNDCFINSSLQLFRALETSLPIDMPQGMPNLLNFLNNDPNLDCRALRLEMANQVMAGHGEFDDLQPTATNPNPAPNLRNVVRKIHERGTAVFQCDAVAFLLQLLEKTKAPKIAFTETLTNPEAAGASRIAHCEETLFPLALPFSEQVIGPLTMQAVIDHSMTSETEVKWNDEDIHNTKVNQTRKFNNPAPSSLIVSIGRFGFDHVTQIGTKRSDVINGVFNTIKLPLLNGEEAIYQPNAIICHVDSSSANSGHYICYKKEGPIWWKFNDLVVTQATYEADNENIQKNCYAISYVKADREICNLFILPSIRSTITNFNRHQTISNRVIHFDDETKLDENNSHNWLTFFNKAYLEKSNQMGINGTFNIIMDDDLKVYRHLWNDKKRPIPEINMLWLEQIKYDEEAYEAMYVASAKVVEAVSIPKMNALIWAAALEAATAKIKIINKEIEVAQMSANSSLLSQLQLKKTVWNKLEALFWIKSGFEIKNEQIVNENIKSIIDIAENIDTAEKTAIDSYKKQIIENLATVTNRLCWERIVAASKKKADEKTLIKEDAAIEFAAADKITKNLEEESNIILKSLGEAKNCSPLPITTQSIITRAHEGDDVNYRAFEARQKSDKALKTLKRAKQIAGRADAIAKVDQEILEAWAEETEKEKATRLAYLSEMASNAWSKAKMAESDANNNATISYTSNNTEHSIAVLDAAISKAKHVKQLFSDSIKACIKIRDNTLEENKQRKEANEQYIHWTLVYTKLVAQRAEKNANIHLTKTGDNTLNSTCLENAIRLAQTVVAASSDIITYYRKKEIYIPEQYKNAWNTMIEESEKQNLFWSEKVTWLEQQMPKVLLNEAKEIENIANRLWNKAQDNETDKICLDDAIHQVAVAISSWNEFSTYCRKKEIYPLEQCTSECDIGVEDAENNQTMWRKKMDSLEATREAMCRKNSLPPTSVPPTHFEIDSPKEGKNTKQVGGFHGCIY